MDWKERLGPERYARKLANARASAARRREKEKALPVERPAKICLNCEASFAPRRRDTLFCGRRCQQIAEWVRYARRHIAAGTIERPDIRAALDSRLGVLIRGFYDKRGLRAVPDDVRAKLRAVGRCQSCGRAFENEGDARFTVQHIQEGDGFRLEAWCHRCNMDQAQSVPMRLADEEMAFVQNCLMRARAPEPLRVCDDAIGWESKWRSYAAADNTR